jgi:hypothetical protein
MVKHSIEDASKMAVASIAAFLVTCTFSFSQTQLGILGLSYAGDDVKAGDNVKGGANFGGDNKGTINIYNFPFTPSSPPQDNQSQQFNPKRSNRDLTRLLLENHVQAQPTGSGVVITLPWLYERRADGQVYLQPTTQRQLMALGYILDTEAAGRHITVSPRYHWRLNRDSEAPYIVEEMVERLLEVLGEAGIKKEDIALFPAKRDMGLGFVRTMRQNPSGAG